MYVLDYMKIIYVLISIDFFLYERFAMAPPTDDIDDFSSIWTISFCGEIFSAELNLLYNVSVH